MIDRDGLYPFDLMQLTMATNGAFDRSAVDDDCNNVNNDPLMPPLLQISDAYTAMVAMINRRRDALSKRPVLVLNRLRTVLRRCNAAIVDQNNAYGGGRK